MASQMPVYLKCMMPYTTTDKRNIIPKACLALIKLGQNGFELLNKLTAFTCTTEVQHLELILTSLPYGVRQFRSDLHFRQGLKQLNFRHTIEPQIF